jgi:shikimate dehydrogenase/3-dehydroquinate dehydratase type I
MKIVTTIHEPTPAAAVEAIRALPPGSDALEIRFDAFVDDDVAASSYAELRAASLLPMIATWRSSAARMRPFSRGKIEGVLAAGFDFADVEWSPEIEQSSLNALRERVILSHHDFDGIPDVDALLRTMRTYGCAHVKLAATPRTFEENVRLLSALPLNQADEGKVNQLTIIGMGERGLYSRTLAPFLGSQLFFASRGDAHSAAPGQISLERAVAIYGSTSERRSRTWVGEVPAVFAIAGNPAGHSLSPSLHNPLFRQHHVDAAYTIASFESFDELAGPLVQGAALAPRGLSITAPFKEDAFVFAERNGATIGDNARACRAINTLVRREDGSLHADNTDVDGFAAVISERMVGTNARVLLLGAGGTARAALLALQRLGCKVTIINRTFARAELLAQESGGFAVASTTFTAEPPELIVNTLTSGASLDLPADLFVPGATFIEAAYGHPSPLARRAQERGMHVVDGLALLRAQAIRQNELFVSAVVPQHDRSREDE